MQGRHIYDLLTFCTTFRGMDIKTWTARASVQARKAKSEISSSGTQQEQYYIMRAWAHVLSRLYTVSLKDRENFYAQVLLLYVKRSTSFLQKFVE